MLGPLCNQAVNLTPKLCILQFTEIKIYSFYCKAQQRLKEICVVKQKPQEQPHKSHEQYILQSRILWSIDRSLHPTRKDINYFASLGIFMGQGRRKQRQQNPCMGITGLKENLRRNDRIE